MSCSPYDLRDFFLKELPEAQRREVEAHARGCAACQAELDELRLTEAALLTLRDEEIPRRVAFVSDPVFEPSAARRWWAAFWASPAQVGFAGAAMLSGAILFSALTRPASVQAPPLVAQAPAQTQAQPASISKEEVDRQVREAVAAAVQQSESRWEGKIQTVLASSLQREREESKRLELAEQFNRNMERRSGAQMAAGYRTQYAASGDQR